MSSKWVNAISVVPSLYGVLSCSPMATRQRPAVTLAERCVIGRHDGLTEAAVCFVVEEPAATKHTHRIPMYSADDLGDVLGGWYGDSDELDGVSGCVQREHAVGGRGVKVGVQPQVRPEALCDGHASP